MAADTLQVCESSFCYLSSSLQYQNTIAKLLSRIQQVSAD
jgi:NADH:ubiquinone oxidoreductase subunit E